MSDFRALGRLVSECGRTHREARDDLGGHRLPLRCEVERGAPSGSSAA